MSYRRMDTKGGTCFFTVNIVGVRSSPQPTHYNPVKHGYVERAVDRPYSSIHQYIKRGGISKNRGFCDWHGDEDAFGERS